LLFIAHHDSEMSHSSGMQLLYLENGEELVLAELEKRITFTAVEFFQIENVLVKRDRLPNVVHFDRDVITSKNLHTHVVAYSKKRSCERSFLGGKD